MCACVRAYVSPLRNYFKKKKKDKSDKKERKWNEAVLDTAGSK